jgi:hypothetical protein
VILGILKAFQVLVVILVVFADAIGDTTLPLAHPILLGLSK